APPPPSPLFPSRRPSDLRGQGLAVGREGQPIDCVAVVLEPPDHLARGEVPDQDLLVIPGRRQDLTARGDVGREDRVGMSRRIERSEEHTSELQSPYELVC